MKKRCQAGRFRSVVGIEKRYQDVGGPKGLRGLKSGSSLLEHSSLPIGIHRDSSDLIGKLSERSNHFRFAQIHEVWLLLVPRGSVAFSVQDQVSSAPRFGKVCQRTSATEHFWNLNMLANSVFVCSYAPNGHHGSANGLRCLDPFPLKQVSRSRKDDHQAKAWDAIANQVGRRIHMWRIIPLVHAIAPDVGRFRSMGAAKGRIRRPLNVFPQIALPQQKGSK